MMFDIIQTIIISENGYLLINSIYGRPSIGAEPLCGGEKTHHDCQPYAVLFLGRERSNVRLWIVDSGGLN